MSDLTLEGNNILPLFWMTLFQPNDISLRYYQCDPDDAEDVDYSLNVFTDISKATENSAQNLLKVRSFFKAYAFLPLEKFDELCKLWFDFIVSTKANFVNAHLTEFAWFFHPAENSVIYLKTLLNFDEISLKNYFCSYLGVQDNNFVKKFLPFMLPMLREKNLSHQMKKHSQSNQLKWLLTGGSDNKQAWDSLEF